LFPGPFLADIVCRMSHRLIAILALFAVLAQAMLGGLSGNVGICLGGGHEHTSDEVVSECDLACNHDAGVSLSASHDDESHNEECPCTDVELELADQLITLRDVHQHAQPMTWASAITRIASECDRVISRRGPPLKRIDDPGGSQRLAIIASTRLLL